MCGAAVKIDKIGIIMTHTIFSMNIQIQVWFIWNTDYLGAMSPKTFGLVFFYLSYYWKVSYSFLMLQFLLALFSIVSAYFMYNNGINKESKTAFIEFSAPIVPELY